MAGSFINRTPAPGGRDERGGGAERAVGGPLTEFNEDDWYSLVDHAMVYSREDIRFTFKNGMEIKA